MKTAHLHLAAAAAAAARNTTSHCQVAFHPASPQLAPHPPLSFSVIHVVCVANGNVSLTDGSGSERPQFCSPLGWLEAL